MKTTTTPTPAPEKDIKEIHQKISQLGHAVSALEDQQVHLYKRLDTAMVSSKPSEICQSSPDSAERSPLTAQLVDLCDRIYVVCNGFQDMLDRLEL